MLKTDAASNSRSTPAPIPKPVTQPEPEEAEETEEGERVSLVFPEEQQGGCSWLVMCCSATMAVLITNGALLNQDLQCATKISQKITLLQKEVL